MINNFLDKIYFGTADEASYLIFDTFYRLLCNGDFEKCNELLQVVDVERFSSFSIRFLVITQPAKDKIPYREEFYLKCKQKMISLRGEMYTDKLIGKLS